MIPFQLNVIEKNVFGNCSELKNLDIKENSELRRIQREAFNNSKINQLYIPSKFSEFEDGWCKNLYTLNHIKISEKNKNFKIFEK